MPAMFHSFVRLFVQIFFRWITFLGTSPAGIVAQLALVIIAEAKSGWWKVSAWRQNWQGGLKRALYALLVVWITAFFVCTITTVYGEHIALVNANSRIAKENEELHATNKTLKAATQRLESVPPNKDQCWIQNYIVPRANDLPAEVVSTSQAVIFCNRKYDVPFALLIEYDHNPIRAGAIVFPMGGMTEMDQFFKDNVISAVFRAPIIRPYEPFLVLAYGATDKLLTVKRITIKTASSTQHFEP